MTSEEVNRIADHLRQIHATAVCKQGSDCIQVDPAQPAWRRKGGYLYSYPGSGSAPTPVPPSIPFEIQPAPEREVVRVLNDVTWQQLKLQVFVSYEELHRAPDRRAFRNLLGERLQTVYNEALAEWEKIHGEESE